MTTGKIRGERGTICALPRVSLLSANYILFLKYGPAHDPTPIVVITANNGALLDWLDGYSKQNSSVYRTRKHLVVSCILLCLHGTKRKIFTFVVSNLHNFLSSMEYKNLTKNLTERSPNIIFFSVPKTKREQIRTLWERSVFDGNVSQYISHRHRPFSYKSQGRIIHWALWARAQVEAKEGKKKMSGCLYVKCK